MFWLAQAWSRINLDSILVDTLQWGVTNQLATMMTTAALPLGQEKAGWRWEQWLDKAGEFYRNIIWLQELRRRDNNTLPKVCHRNLEKETTPRSGGNGHRPDKPLSIWKNRAHKEEQMFYLSQDKMPTLETLQNWKRSMDHWPHQKKPLMGQFTSDHHYIT